MERLSGLDSTFLYFETPTNHMHVSALMMFDPTTVEGGYSFEATKAFIESRLHLIPPFRRRLLTVPFNLGHPVWIEDPGFDLDYHVRRIGVPAPGGPQQLADLAGDIASRPLNRERPLWQVWVCEGMADGTIAVITKMHHCTVDGVSGANMMMHLFDLSPEPASDAKPEPDDWHPGHRPSDTALVADALLSQVTFPLRVARVVPDTVRALVNVVRERRSPDTPPGATPLTAPRTSFNAAVTSHRKVAFTAVSLDDVKTVKNAFGTTVNDVVLAICAGALRRYLEEGDELPDKALVATCPVSVRTEETEQRRGSNKVSAMFVSLPTQLDDPVARLLAIHESTKGAKEEHKAVGAHMLMQWAELAAPNTFAQAARLYSAIKLANRHPVIHNLVISNVPGPPFPLYFAGAKLLAMHPLGPVFDGAGLNVTVLSYQDEVGFGLIACRELMPRLWDLSDAIADSTAELLKAAQAQSSSRRRATKRTTA